jgi:hypothetical protein
MMIGVSERGSQDLSNGTKALPLESPTFFCLQLFTSIDYDPDDLIIMAVMVAALYRWVGKHELFRRDENLNVFLK